MNNSKQIEIKVFSSEYKEDVIDLIVGIQQKEFGIAVTAEDQPDLNNIRKRSQAPHLHAIRATSIADYSWSP